jgi:hypothetical protein
MKFMVLMYSNPADTKVMSAPDRDTVARKHAALRADLASSGELLNGAGLDYPEEATTMRWRDGVMTSADGLFLDAGEQLTAYYLIDCEGPERARSIAERVLDFHVTAVEVRRVHDSFGMGTARE